MIPTAFISTNIKPRCAATCWLSKKRRPWQTIGQKPPPTTTTTTTTTEAARPTVVEIVGQAKTFDGIFL
jgi:hypothetical protein